MCDYSLHNVASRPAKVGDRLVIKSFWNTCTRGFAAVDDPLVAVCLLPGSELAFEDDVERERPFPPFRRKEHTGNLARFRRVNTDNPFTHHDAIELADGKILLLTVLRKGQKATVLQLPAGGQKRHEPAEVEANSRTTHVIRTSMAYAY